MEKLEKVRTIVKAIALISIIVSIITFIDIGGIFNIYDSIQYLRETDSIYMSYELYNLLKFIIHMMAVSQSIIFAILNYILKCMKRMYEGSTERTSTDGV